MIAGAAAPAATDRRRPSADGGGRRSCRWPISPACASSFVTRTIVLCHGAFDLVHMGHLIHFEEARGLGDLLVVTITADRHITKKRSVSLQRRLPGAAGRGARDRRLRRHRRRAVGRRGDRGAPAGCVRQGPGVLEPAARQDVEHLAREGAGRKLRRPDPLHVRRDVLLHEAVALPAVVARKRSRTIPCSATTASCSATSRRWATGSRRSSAFWWAPSQLRVCLLGETIIDEWVDVTVENISQKSRCVAGLETARVRQIGGAGIIALHLAGFVDERRTASPTGSIRRGRPGERRASRRSPTSPLVKTRFVDKNTGFPLFESKQLALATRAAAIAAGLRRLRSGAPGRFRPRPARRGGDQPRARRASARRSSAPWSQVNSSNYGYNLPTKYIGAGLLQPEPDRGRAVPARAGPPAAGARRSDGGAAALPTSCRSPTAAAARCARCDERPVLAADAQHERRGYDRLRRRLLRAQQPRRVPGPARRGWWPSPAASAPPPWRNAGATSARSPSRSS